MSDQSSNLALPFLMPAQAQKHVTVNESLLRLDALVQLGVVSATVTAQPGSPVDGQCYILPAGKTGAAWGAMANGDIAYYRDGAWEAVTPREGFLAYVKDTDAVLAHDGSAWGALPIALPDGAVSDAKLRDSAALSVIGRATNTTGAPADIAASNDGEVLRRAGTALGFGQIGLGALPDDLVTYAKIQDVSATDRLLGRESAGAGNIEELSVSGGLEFTGAGGLQTSAFTGDVTKAAGATALAIADDAVTFAKLLDATQASYVGATGAGSFGERTFAQVLSDIAAMPLAGGTFTGAVSGVTLALAQGAITAAATPLAITATWNNAGVTFDALDVNVTNTASGGASRLANLRVGGTSQFAVTRAGNVSCAGGFFPSGGLEGGSAGAIGLFNRGHMRAPSDGEFTLRNYANTAYGGLMIARMRLSELSSDPSDPSEGNSVIWQSDGAGAGDDGDIMIKITAGGVTKTGTLIDFSAL